MSRFRSFANRVRFIMSGMVHLVSYPVLLWGNMSGSAYFGNRTMPCRHHVGGKVLILTRFCFVFCDPILF